MKVIERVLDDVHTLARDVERATRRKKRLRREHLVSAFHFARVIANGAAAVAPKAIPVAVVLNSLNNTVKPNAEDVRDATNSKSHSRCGKVGCDCNRTLRSVAAESE